MRGASLWVQGGWPQRMGCKWGITVSAWVLGGGASHQGKDGAVLSVGEAGGLGGCTVSMAPAGLAQTCSVVSCEPSPWAWGTRAPAAPAMQGSLGCSSSVPAQAQKSSSAGACPVLSLHRHAAAAGAEEYTRG